MESNQRPTASEAAPTTRPSSVCTQIAVGLGTTPEEELYAAAEAMLASSSNAAATAAPPTAQSGIMDAIDVSSPGGPFDFEADMEGFPVPVTSSIWEHVYEGGLRYHAYRNGKYAFPNDEVEQNRDDMKHTMTLMLCHGAYFYAPVGPLLEAGGEVLDLGTGTGIWAIELGDKYPNARITGIDLSPIQPNFVPENVHFFVDDFEEEWVDPENKYDFIHLRHTMHSVKDFPTLLSRVMRHLKPGGYFEVQDLFFTPGSDDGTINSETPYALRDYIHYMEAGMRVLGSNLNGIITVPEEMKAAGFEDVRVTTHKCPIGLWPRDKRLRFCGLFLRTVLMDGLRGLSRRPFMALGWTQLQIEMFLVEVRKAVMNGDVHAYYTLHMVHGRKPMS
ncbi:hypothetical protein VTK56DRAFT_9704 [Thermocarpiscus australiensis]